MKTVHQELTKFVAVMLFVAKERETWTSLKDYADKKAQPQIKEEGLSDLPGRNYQIEVQSLQPFV